jgi:hypothetical protein
MSSVITVKLPSGFWKDGICYHHAEMRLPSAQDQLDLAGDLDAMLPARCVTALLTRSLLRLGPMHPVSLDHVRSLTVGDRESLLLQFHQAFCGDRLDSVVTCPTCGQAMDVPLSAAEMLCGEGVQPSQWYEDVFHVQGRTVRVRFRVPTGEDQELAAEIALDDLDAAATFLLKRCIAQVSFDSGDPTYEGPAWLDDQSFLAALAYTLSERMAEIDPQAEVILHLSCPSCGHSFQSLLDPAEFVRHELLRAQECVHQDIHLLALHYHWSERDILALPAKRRAAYLQLLANAGRS